MNEQSLCVIGEELSDLRTRGLTPASELFQRLGDEVIHCYWSNFVGKESILYVFSEDHYFVKPLIYSSPLENSWFLKVQNDVQGMLFLPAHPGEKPRLWEVSAVLLPRGGGRSIRTPVQEALERGGVRRENTYSSCEEKGAIGRWQRWLDIQWGFYGISLCGSLGIEFIYGGKKSGHVCVAHGRVVGWEECRREHAELCLDVCISS